MYLNNFFCQMNQTPLVWSSIYLACKLLMPLGDIFGLKIWARSLKRTRMPLVKMLGQLNEFLKY